MIDHGKVRSTVKPEEKVIDEYSVWLASNISAVSKKGTDGKEGFTGFEYNLVQYNKDEYIKMLDDQMTQAQEAMCDLYEMIGK